MNGSVDAPTIHTPRWAFEPWLSKDYSSTDDTLDDARDFELPIQVQARMAAGLADVGGVAHTVEHHAILAAVLRLGIAEIVGDARVCFRGYGARLLMQVADIFEPGAAP